jgi:hypothetical protein
MGVFEEAASAMAAPASTPATSAAPATDPFAVAAQSMTPSVDQQFQADPAIQSAADHYVQDKWREYGGIASQSHGQRIRDFAIQHYGIAADRYHPNPERDNDLATRYVQSTVAPEVRQQLEQKWRQEYLGNALPNAVAHQTEVAHPYAERGRETGRVEGAANQFLAGLTDLVLPAVRGGAAAVQTVASDVVDGPQSLYGAKANDTEIDLQRRATDIALGGIQGNVEAAYSKSTAAQQNPGGVTDMVEGGIRSLPALMAGGGAFEAGGVQKGLAYAQMAAQTFGGSYDTVYQAGLHQGLPEHEAANAALQAGVADAAVNTYLMKFGALGQTASRTPGLRGVLATVVKSAIAQGAVGAGQQSVSEVTKYAATGEPGQVENILHAAIQNAGVGAAFGGIHAAGQRVAERPGQTKSAEVSAAANPAPSATVESGGKQVTVPVPDAEALRNATITPTTEVPGAKPAANGGGDGSVPGSDARPAAGVTSDAAATAAPAGPAEPFATPLLDKGNAKHRVHNGDGTSTSRPVEFANKTDKALYAASAERQGKVGKEARAFLEADGHSDASIAEKGKALRERVQALHDAQPGTEPIKVPDERVQAVPATEPVAARPEPVVASAESRPESGVPKGEGERPAGAVRPDGAAERPVGGPDGGPVPAAEGTKFKPDTERAADVERAVADLPRIRPEAKVVAPSRVLKAAASVAERVLGVKVVHVHDSGGAAGFAHPDHPGVVFVDARRPVKSWARVVAHEWMHDVQRVSPKAAEAFYEAIPAKLKAKYLADYKASLGRLSGVDRAKYLTPEVIKQEIGATAMTEAATRGEVRRAMLGQDATLWDKVVDVGTHLADRLTGKSEIMDKALKLVRERPAVEGEKAGEKSTSFMPDDERKVGQDESNARIARELIRDPRIADDMQPTARRPVADFLRRQLELSKGMAGRDDARAKMQAALDRLDNGRPTGDHPYRDELNPTGDTRFAPAGLDQFVKEDVVEKAKGGSSLPTWKPGSRSPTLPSSRRQTP